MNWRTAITVGIVIGVAALAAVILMAATPVPAPPPPPPRPGHNFAFFPGGGSRLGVRISDVDAERARELKLKEEAGAEIKEVRPDGAAAKAGLKPGDVVLEYQGNRIEGAAQLTRLVQETPSGRTVALKIWRDGASRPFSVKLQEREGDDRRVFERRIVVPHMAPDADVDIPDLDIEIPDIEMPDIPMLDGIPQSVRIGVSIENLSDQLAAYFGVKGGGGVLVRSVQEGSRAAEAGLKAGDVIVKVDQETIGDSSDFRAALRQRRGKGMNLTLVRDRREHTVAVAAPREDERGRHDAGWRGRDGLRRAVETAARQSEEAFRQAAEELNRAEGLDL